MATLIFEQELQKTNLIQTERNISLFFFFFLLEDWALPEEEKKPLDCSTLAGNLSRCHPVRYRHVDLKKKKKV